MVKSSQHAENVEIVPSPVQYRQRKPRFMKERKEKIKQIYEKSREIIKQNNEKKAMLLKMERMITVLLKVFWIG